MFIIKCTNCESPTEIVFKDNIASTLCQACQCTLNMGYYKKRSNGETEGFVNRRWQMRFNRGELPTDIECNAGVLWQTKKKLQDW